MLVCKTTYAKNVVCSQRCRSKLASMQLRHNALCHLSTPLCRSATLGYPGWHLRLLQRGRLLQRLCKQKGLHAADVNAIATQMSAPIAQRAAVAQEIDSTLRCWLQMQYGCTSHIVHREDYIHRYRTVVLTLCIQKRRKSVLRQAFL